MLGFFTSSGHVVPALSTGPLERAGHDDVGIAEMPPPHRPFSPRSPPGSPLAIQVSPSLVFLAVGMPGYLLPHLRGPFADIILPAHSCPEYQGCLSTLGRARVGATVMPPVGCTPVFLP